LGSTNTSHLKSVDVKQNHTLRSNTFSTYVARVSLVYKISKFLKLQNYTS